MPFHLALTPYILEHMPGSIDSVLKLDERIKRIGEDFADEHAGILETENITLLPVSPNDDCIAPIIFTIPLQLLAYHMAVLKGADVDQPRNLAKSVAVE